MPELFKSVNKTLNSESIIVCGWNRVKGVIYFDINWRVFVMFINWSLYCGIKKKARCLQDEAEGISFSKQSKSGAVIIEDINIICLTKWEAAKIIISPSTRVSFFTASNDGKVVPWEDFGDFGHFIIGRVEQAAGSPLVKWKRHH